MAKPRRLESLIDNGMVIRKRKARERHEEAIRRWRKEDWPRIKKREHFVKLASCLSTNPASVCSP